MNMMEIGFSPANSLEGIASAFLKSKRTALETTQTKNQCQRFSTSGATHRNMQ
jgi:hypothetical protein